MSNSQTTSQPTLRHIVLLHLFVPLTALLLVLMPASVRADDLYTDFQTWYLLTAIVPVDEERKFSIYTEVQPRLGNSSSYPERLLLRPAAVYNVNRNLSLFLGYAWTPTFMDARFNERRREEHRTWQQLMYTHPLFDSELILQHRFRQEQRYIEFTDDTAHRTRYLLRLSHPFKSGGKSGLTGYNEYFLNLNDVDGGPQSGFDRNRFFFGPYVQDGPARFEFGYIGEYGNRYRDGNRMLSAAMFSVGFVF